MASSNDGCGCGCLTTVLAIIGAIVVLNWLIGGEPVRVVVPKGPVQIVVPKE